MTIAQESSSESALLTRAERIAILLADAQEGLPTPWIMTRLIGAPGRSRQFSETACLQALSQLERRGHVERTREGRGKRPVVWCLTDEGRMAVIGQPSSPETDSTAEVWRPVRGWDDLYEVSNLGNVRSKRRRGGNNRVYGGRVLKPSLGSSGYREISLCRPGVHVTVRIHRIVLDAFVGPCPPGYEACHGPGGPLDNRWPENLQWGTFSKNNHEDKVRDGTTRRGVPCEPLRGGRNHQAKLADDDVREIRRRYASGGIRQRDLAERYAVDQTMISLIIRRRKWAWLDD